MIDRGKRYRGANRSVASYDLTGGYCRRVRLHEVSKARTLRDILTYHKANPSLGETWSSTQLVPGGPAVTGLEPGCAVGGAERKRGDPQHPPVRIQMEVVSRPHACMSAAGKQGRHFFRTPSSLLFRGLSGSSSTGLFIQPVYKLVYFTTSHTGSSCNKGA